MKKSIKTILFSLFACSLGLLAACVPPDQYKITASVSDSLLGSVVGADDIYLNTRAEGTRITLKVNELKPTTNPFICWIKDYNNVVSLEDSLSLTYSANTAGHYVALFEETNYDKMTYASLTDLSFEPETELANDTTVEYSVIINLTGLDTTKPNYTGDLNKNESVYKATTDNHSVFCLYNTEEGNRNFTVQVKITLKTKDSSEELTFNFNNDVLGKSSFDTEGKCTFLQTRDGKTITLNFEKLSKAMYE